jgi:hypothetical protein
MQSNSPIMLQRPGEEPVQLSNQEIVNMIQEQQKQLATIAQKCGEYENIITILQKQLVEKTKSIRELSQNKSSNIQTTITEKDISSEGVYENKKISDLENMISMLQKQLVEKTKTIRELSTTQQKVDVSPNNNDSKKYQEHQNLQKENNDLQKMVGMLQQQLIEKTIALREMKKSLPINHTGNINSNKSEPEVFVDIGAT